MGPIGCEALGAFWPIPSGTATCRHPIASVELGGFSDKASMAGKPCGGGQVGQEGCATIGDWPVEIEYEELAQEPWQHIGRGSFANIYRATFRGELVAIKVPLTSAAAMSDDDLVGLANEISVLRKLDHENIIKYIGTAINPKTQEVCIVSELAAQGSLYDQINTSGRVFEADKVTSVALAIAKGMAYMHSQKLLHRDLKAANVLVTADGVIKIADFGLARVIARGREAMTAEVGSYRWIAPEVLAHKPYDEKADVYSFAITLWELLTGEVPFADMTPIQAAFAVVGSGCRLEVPDDVPNKLKQLLKMCWSNSPRRRPSFIEIIAMLEDGPSSKRPSRHPSGGILKRAQHKFSNTGVSSSEERGPSPIKKLGNFLRRASFAGGTLPLALNRSKSDQPAQKNQAEEVVRRFSIM